MDWIGNLQVGGSIEQLTLLKAFITSASTDSTIDISSSVGAVNNGASIISSSTSTVSSSVSTIELGHCNIMKIMFSVHLMELAHPSSPAPLSS